MAGATDAGPPARPAGPTIRVVVFTSGPTLEAAAGDFILRLDDHPEIELLSVVHQTHGGGLGGLLRDLRRRRGALALPLLLLHLARDSAPLLSRPLRERQRRRRLAGMRERIHRVADIHAPEVIGRVRALEPDLGLIYGAPILKPRLFEIPRLGTLGIHHGKLPEYRGKKTTFWAIFHGESSVGVTIQRVNAGLDTGEIVKEGAVPVGRQPLRPVWNRLQALGLDLYVEAILDTKRGIARPRAAAGPRRAPFRDPAPRDILVFWWRYLLRLLRGTGSPPRARTVR